MIAGNNGDIGMKDVGVNVNTRVWMGMYGLTFGTGCRGTTVGTEMMSVGEYADEMEMGE